MPTFREVARRVLVVILVFAGLLAPAAAGAQAAGKIYRIGVLETTSSIGNAANLAAFREGLQEAGYVVGRNVVLEYRYAEGRPERFKELAAELVRLKVDVIVTRGTPAVLAAKEATNTMPIVMAASGDPILSGIVPSLARPGGNVTGLSATTVEVNGKRLELLRALLPKMGRVAVLLNMANPNNVLQWKEIESVGRTLGIQAQRLDVRKADDIAPAFDAATNQKADAMVVVIEAITQANQLPIVRLAARHRLPAMYASREFVEGGGLIAYGVNYADLYRRAARYVDKIFKGAKPADLPIEQPTTFELLVNRKTAQALGLTIPQTMLMRADQVIE
jgi:putative tryptophan/tyrosine transport system substrate-binding protein